MKKTSRIFLLIGLFVSFFGFVLFFVGSMLSFFDQAELLKADVADSAEALHATGIFMLIVSFFQALTLAFGFVLLFRKKKGQALLLTFTISSLVLGWNLFAFLSGIFALLDRKENYAR